MQAHPAHPARSWQACGGSIASRAGRGLSAWVWLLVLGVVLQGSVLATTRAAEPAHVHARALANHDRDPMLDSVRMVQNHHGAARHHHSEVQRHAHDEMPGDVIYLDEDEDTKANAAQSAKAKRMAADLDTPTIGLAPPAVLQQPGAVCATLLCDYTSHVGARLDRPPR